MQAEPGVDAQTPTAALPKPEPTPEAIERARAAYARGQEAFERADYRAALEAFKQAYSDVSNPIVLLSIAESAVQLDHVETALAAYDAYLKARPDAPDREEVAQKRAALAAARAPARLTLTSEPAGADVVVDGQLTGRVTPLTLELRPGQHRVSLVLIGYETSRLAVALRAGAHEQRATTLQPSATPPPVVPVAKPQPPAVEPSSQPAAAAAVASEPPRAAIITTAGLGAAGIIAGTVLGIFTLKERSDYNANPTESGANRGERLALFTDVSFGIGAMSLITTAVLLLTHDTTQPGDSPDDSKQAARLEWLPSISAHGAAASAKVRF